MMTFFEPGDRRNFLLLRCLPVVLAGPLIFWLSGGLSSPTWILLAKTGMQLFVQKGESLATLLLPLCILLLQALLLIACWIGYLWLIVRIIMDFKGLVSAQPAVSGFQSLQAPPPAVQPPRVPARSSAPAYPPSAGNPHLPLPVAFGADSPTQPAPHRLAQAAPTHFAIPSDPYAVNSADVLVFNPFEAMAGGGEQPAISDSPPDGEEKIDEVPAPPEEPQFLYGNPFETRLPELFHEDEDLKRIIEEQGHPIDQPPKDQHK